MKTMTQTKSKVNTINDKVLRLFNCALETNDNFKFSDVNELALSLGYIVHPKVCNSDVVDYLKDKKIDYSSTFYKNWDDVTSKNRFELLIDQLMHYASTYGTNFTGEVYLPKNTNTSEFIVDFTTYKTIMLITNDELISRCMTMLTSGIALSETTISDLMFILEGLNYKPKISLIKNKEAKMFLCKNFGLLPDEPVEMVRYLVYLATNNTLLIKNKKAIFELKNSKFDITNYVNQFGVNKLASVFNRFKPIFLAFKSNPNNVNLINKLGRSSKINHVPLEKGFFEQILTNQKLYPKLADNLLSLNNYKKIALLQTINIRLKNLESSVFLIRNKKTYLKKIDRVNDSNYLKLVYDTIMSSLIDSMKAKATTIALPENMDLTIPTSEKSFVGNYPNGTRVNMGKNNLVFGINWKSVDGADDLDLSLIDIHNSKIGWNANYYNTSKSVLYSGDMTSADPEATELVYAENGFDKYMVKVNLFRGTMDSKFKCFIGSEKMDSPTYNAMINPDNIICEFDLTMDSKEKTFGILLDNMFYLCDLNSGEKIVSSGDRFTSEKIQYITDIVDTYISLKSVLLDAGFTLDDKNPKIDLRRPAKDTLINLFS